MLFLFQCLFPQVTADAH